MSSKKKTKKHGLSRTIRIVQNIRILKYHWNIAQYDTTGQPEARTFHKPDDYELVSYQVIYFLIPTLFICDL